MAIRTVTTYIAVCDSEDCNCQETVAVLGRLPERWIGTTSGDTNSNSVYIQDGHNRPIMAVRGGLMFCSLQCFCDYVTAKLDEYRERVKLINQREKGGD